MLVTCAFGFVVRAEVIGEWQTEFNLSETQKGDILGVGFWPFAFSIFAFSFMSDKVGYGRGAVFWPFLPHCLHRDARDGEERVAALLGHVYFRPQQRHSRELYQRRGRRNVSPRKNQMTLHPPCRLARRHRTRRRHRHRPERLVVADKNCAHFSTDGGLRALLVGQKFPISERVAAGVSYREMLADFGALGMFAATYLIGVQVCESILHLTAGQFLWPLLPATILAGAFGLGVRSLGQPVYFFLLLIMLPLATTELGVDSWITELMGPEMGALGLNAGWVLVYTATIMTVLRFFAGPLVHKLSPLGLLACCAALAVIGLLTLSRAAGATILIAATLYGVGKTFFWPTMLGVVAERFPRGGVLTLNCIGGVGMLGLSVGMIFLGNIQDKRVAADLVARDHVGGSVLAATYLGAEKASVFGAYRALDQAKLKAAPAADQQTVAAVQAGATKNALSTAAIFPAIMLACYLTLILHFKSRAGYRNEKLDKA